MTTAPDERQMTAAPDERPALLCIAPSPAIDRTARVERITPGVVLRPFDVVALPGGKGVNAARAAARLGGRVITTGIAGGHAGRWMVEALESEGLAPRFATARAESRTTYVTVDRTGASILVYEPPGLATEAEFGAFLHLLEVDLLPASGRAIVAGSLPGGIGPESYGLIVEACRAAGRPLLVDASGSWLRGALAAGPDIVKVGRVEVAEAGLIEDDASTRSAAETLVGHGARLAVVTDGRAPVVACDADWVWVAEVPQVRAVNAVGSGDAMNAGLSLAFEGGDDVETALVRGVAAAVANALALAAGMLDASVARDLEPRVRVTHERR